MKKAPWCCPIILILKINRYYSSTERRRHILCCYDAAALDGLVASFMGDDSLPPPTRWLLWAGFERQQLHPVRADSWSGRGNPARPATRAGAFSGLRWDITACEHGSGENTCTNRFQGELGFPRLAFGRRWRWLPLVWSFMQRAAELDGLRKTLDHLQLRRLKSAVFASSTWPNTRGALHVPAGGCILQRFASSPSVTKQRANRRYINVGRPGDLARTALAGWADRHRLALPDRYEFLALLPGFANGRTRQVCSSGLRRRRNKVTISITDFSIRGVASTRSPVYGHFCRGALTTTSCHVDSFFGERTGWPALPPALRAHMAFRSWAILVSPSDVWYRFYLDGGQEATRLHWCVICLNCLNWLK